MLSQYLTPDTPFTPLTCFPEAGDAVYTTIPSETRRALIADGERYLHYEYPALPAALYMEFCRNGNRERFETPYFARRQALSALAAAECVEHEGRFLDDIVNGLWCILEESSWTIPAHNAYDDEGVKLPLPRLRPILDLFSCETGAVLATVYRLLSQDLAAVSPEIPDRIRREIDRRVTVPFLSEHFWWMGSGKNTTNNWTVWCTQNVLYSVFQLPYHEDIYRQAAEIAVGCVDRFIDDYGYDGACTEGAGYYHHAALCMHTCIDILNRVSDGAFAPVLEEKKIRNIASYIMKVHVADEYYLNFADCNIFAGLSGVREYSFAKDTGQEDMMRFASEQYNLKKERYGLSFDGRGIFGILEEAFLREEALAYCRDLPAEGKKAGFKKFASFPSAGIHAAEGDRLYLAVKSGNNTGSHKHNDVGSFIIYADGKPLFVDPGVETYTRETFSDKRYDIWTMQSCWHNLPTIEGFDECGLMQYDAEKYYALDVDLKRKEILDSEAYLHSMELKNAYDENAPIETYIREIRFISDGPVEITEHLRLKEDAFPHWTLHFITEAEPVYLPAENALRIGDRGRLVFDRPILDAATEKIEITDPQLKSHWPDGLYRTNVQPIGGVLRYLITAE